MWTIPTVTVDGDRILVHVGQVEYEGRLETAFRVDSGPIVLLPIHAVAGDVLAAIRQQSLDTYKRNMRGEQP